jgi:hypothetical protein
MQRNIELDKWIKSLDYYQAIKTPLNRNKSWRDKVRVSGARLGYVIRYVEAYGVYWLIKFPPINNLIERE